jgi:hypothetical protein
MHYRTKVVHAKCKCNGVSKKGHQCLKKSFDVVPLSEDLKHANKVLR